MAKRFSAGLFSALLASSVYADGLAEPRSEILETITVTETQTLKEAGDNSTASSVVDSSAIDLRSSTHPSELFSAIPGVWISRGNGQEHLTAIRSPVLTGAGSCGAFAVLEGDISVRGAGFCNVNQLFDLPLSQAQKIQVLRGPASVLYGSDAQHGVIRLLSEAPAESLRWRLGLEQGANDFTRVTSAYSNTVGRNGIRLGLSGSRDGGYKMDSGYDQQKLSVRHDYLGDRWYARTLVSFSNLNQETAGYVTGKDAYKDPHRKRENPNPEAFRDSQSARLQTRFEYHTDSGDRWLLTPYVRHTDMAFLMHFLPGTPLEENGQQGAGVQSSYLHSFSDSVALTSGADLEVTDAWLKQTQSEGFSSFPGGRQYDYQVTGALLAVFANAELEVAEHSRLTFGSRWEALEYDYDNLMRSGDTAEDGSFCINGFTGAIGCRYSRPDDRRDRFANLSFNAALEHVFHPGLAGSLRLAHGYRAPQAAELYRLQNGQMEAELDSESIDSIELGLSRGSDNLRWRIAGYYMEKSDVIFQSSDRLNLSDGETRHYGVEYELAWQFARHWDLSFSGDFARHRYTSDVSEPGSGALIETKGNDIDTAPRRQHSLVLGRELAKGTRVELQWQGIGSYYTDIENVHRYEGHDLLYMRMRHQLNPRLNLGLRINNLANVDYAERADFSSLAGGDRYFIGEPRSVFGDIRYEF
ncbi:TonB-dependent receptor [Microbulbifer bruguierae]|uniref:TonB-dependent receptor n=1 Tax=Microbulbifer bruguierae TaxID=3029061 RepID=A0ABY8NFS6_9GAMM|nr:TonB-dependent receptor [Microbulbifer bruguierae]WGL17530.1 TonB-dependent receptor [Microbulbifer bruguierae]